MNEVEYELLADVQLKQPPRIVEALQVFTHEDQDHFVILLNRTNGTRQAVVVSSDDAAHLILDVRRPTYGEPLDAEFLHLELSI